MTTTTGTRTDGTRTAETRAALSIESLVVPERLDEPDAADFLAFAALNRRICEHDAGRPELCPSPEEMLPAWRDTTDMLSLGFVARRGKVIVGMVAVYISQEEGSTIAEFDLLVAPEEWGEGIEDALLARAEEEGRRRARTSLQTWTLHRPAEGADAMDALTPRTGWGRVSETPLAAFLGRHGYALEQVERNSEFDLRADAAPLTEMLERACTAAGPDYRQLSWTLPTPPELRDGFAAILARMAMDAPSGDLDIDEERWDAARVERRERHFAEAGQLVSVAAVIHEPSGVLAAYNELVVGADRTRVTHQYGTLVHAEHRGHRLGTIVKCANLLRWRELVPDSPVVSTFNAEENRPMLDINEAIGFAPASYAAAWQKPAGA
ncbi:GNAT superfamily N-acetyltransferase [Microbacterium resistens]|uniref:GNAT superfamily N-acetyltransferase n=1 Tax=Microbacterium resistens TaxID=156977 RepID=A0ABU1S8M1_9MICO|nr:GNAT family N-acetyltransferase [Microbacterium resistens]MDR6865967.1 GNAT superfamily N-acetyltransferase [Microbacterium resistens]